jgi:hypothetical protein
MDNRLDFISRFRDDQLAKAEMQEIRFKIIAIDNYLKDLTKKSASPSFLRSLSLARTNLEQSLQYTIKALCLFWEDKE